MLAISPLRGSNYSSDHRSINMETTFSIGASDDFPDFAGSNLLDSIDFDDLFMSMHDDHTDMLPDLEMDPDLLAEFSLSGEEDSNNSSIENSNPNENYKDILINDGGYDNTKEDNTKNGSVKRGSSEEEIQSRKEARKKQDPIPGPGPDPESDSTTTTVNSMCKEEGKKVKKSSVNNKTRNDNNNNNQGKRKAKVDWTPELHRRFVQAVEQLGVDKAVPSRILELMGIDCLTRHNIASHLQKYRSHRKHLLAREAEAANWTQKRQVYSVAKCGGPNNNNNNNNINAWHSTPMMCFPPMSTMHLPFRPLHVWGHPTMDLHSRMPPPMWPKPPLPSPSPPPQPPPAWTPPPSVDSSFWNPPHHRVQNGMTQAAPCFPQPLPATRFPAPPVPVPGIPSHAIYRADHGVIAPRHPSFDAHLSKESVDAALGDILAKPWQPLPIGLKPPSIDSVLVELQRQGVPNIPPSSST